MTYFYLNNDKLLSLRNKVLLELENWITSTLINKETESKVTIFLSLGWTKNQSLLEEFRDKQRGLLGEWSFLKVELRKGLINQKSRLIYWFPASQHGKDKAVQSKHIQIFYTKVWCKMGKKFYPWFKLVLQTFINRRAMSLLSDFWGTEAFWWILLRCFKS